MENINNCWLSLHGKSDNRNFNHRKFDKQRLVGFAEKEIKRTQEINISLLDSSDFFDFKEKDNLKKFDVVSKESDFPICFFRGCVSGSNKIVIDPLTSKFCSPLASICSGLFNFVLLGSNEKCWLIQHHLFIRAIYYPLRRIVLTLGKGIEPFPIYSLSGFIVKVLSNHRIISCNINSKHPKFGGIIAYYGRPSHFYYDLMPNVKNIVDNVPGITRYQTKATSGNLFFSFKKAFGFVDELILPEEKINEHSLHNNLFYIRPGYATRERDLLSSELDDALVDKALNELTCLDNCYLDDFQACRKMDFVFWIGACAEKRSWIEQLDVILDILHQLSKYQLQIAVIFDGITASVDEDENLIRISKGKPELDIVGRVIDRFSGKFRFVNLIGANSYAKMAFATLTDFYFCNASTDSMYPARFAQKSGVCHGSNAMKPSMHKHYRTVFIPLAFVQDLDSVNNKNKSKIDYSIDRRIATDIVLSEINKIINYGATKKDNNFFMPLKANVTIEKHEDFTMFEVRDDDKFYCSINNKQLNFNNPGNNYVIIEHDKLYSFYFHGQQNLSLNCSLFIIAHDKSKRVYSTSMNLGKRLEVIFPSEACSFRYFIRFNGIGKLKFWGAGHTTHHVRSLTKVNDDEN